MHKHEDNLADLLIRVKNECSDTNPTNIAIVKKAYTFGTKAHHGQVRANGKDYFTEHCVAVAGHIIDLGLDTTLVCAALLHDTVEDTDITTNDVANVFGVEIAELVEGVSKVSQVQYFGNERHVESLRKFFVSVAKDVRVVILKLADRWHNLETLEFIKPVKQKHVALESIMIHAPLASRLGMGKLVSTINDLAFPYAYPDEYERTKKLMDSQLKKADSVLRKFYRNLAIDLHKSLGYTPKIDQRIKGTFSLYKKLERKNWNLDEIYDLVAMRAIVKNVTDCYQSLGIIHEHWKPVPGRIKDYIAVPKPNGYKSLHTAVFSGDGPIVEVQIRTEEMNEYNEYGVASHHSYKNTRVQKGAYKESFAWIEQLRELQDLDMTPAEYLKSLSSDFIHDRIFAFTPKGDVIDLPLGATILDFAYAIHSDIGEHASGGRINGKFMALKTPLSNEDIVEIVANPKSKPSDKWLEYCVTSNALSNIRRHIKSNSLQT